MTKIWCCRLEKHRKHVPFKKKITLYFASTLLTGGDAPEAVADALHQVLKLSWRPTAVKICVFISDAPPHGLGTSSDHFPDGKL